MISRQVKLSLIAILLSSPLFLGFAALSKTESISLSSDPPFPTNSPLLYVDPSITNTTAGVDFTVSLKIFNLTNNIIELPDPYGRPQLYPLGNLYGLEFRLTWDPTVLEYRSRKVTIPVETYPGGVLHQPFMKVSDTVNSVAGTYDIVYASTNPAEPFNNPGQSNTVFNMTFRAKKPGASALTITAKPPATEVKLGTAPGQVPNLYPLITHEKRDGLFTTPGAPTADFTYWPPDGYAGKDKPVIFNASASSDPDGTISLYMWDFGDGTKQNSTEAIVNHVYTAKGGYKARLKVLDNEGANSAHRERSLIVVDRRDISIKEITLNATTLLRGDMLGINVTISNLGGAPETFEASTYYNSTSVSPTGTTWTLIDRADVKLNATQPKLIQFHLDTDTLPAEPKTYYIFANLTNVPHEYNVTDNNWDFANDPRYVRVVTTVSNDVALSSLGISVTSAGEKFTTPFVKGENVTIAFSVKANQTAEEVCDITLRVKAANGTVLMEKEWLDQLLPRQTVKGFNYHTTSLAAGVLNISITATIEEVDVDPSDNVLLSTIKVVNPPVIQIDVSPDRVYADSIVTLSAEASSQAGGSISQYYWAVKPPGSEAYGNTKTGPTAVYTLNKTGGWSVRLIVTDSEDLTYNLLRKPATDVYLKEITVDVQGGGTVISWEVYVALGAIIAIVVVVALVYLMRARRLRQPELPTDE